MFAYTYSSAYNRQWTWMIRTADKACSALWRESEEWRYVIFFFSFMRPWIFTPWIFEVAWSFVAIEEEKWEFYSFWNRDYWLNFFHDAVSKLMLISIRIQRDFNLPPFFKNSGWVCFFFGGCMCLCPWLWHADAHAQSWSHQIITQSECRESAAHICVTFVTKPSQRLRFCCVSAKKNSFKRDIRRQLWCTQIYFSFSCSFPSSPRSQLKSRSSSFCTNIIDSFSSIPLQCPTCVHGTCLPKEGICSCEPRWLGMGVIFLFWILCVLVRCL